jgi:hydroxyquinol 1,2-dioxygenase
MQIVNLKNVTERIIETNNGASDARTREILAALVRHLHDFVQEVHLTPAERVYAIDFLTRAGKFTGDLRNEFSALSDVLGLTAIVDLLNDEGAGQITHGSLLGPFFVENAPLVEYGADLRGDLDGHPVVLLGKVLDKNRTPVSEAQIEFWETRADGFYDVQLEGPYTPQLRCRTFTRRDGSYKIRAIRPTGYTAPMDGPLGELLRATKRNIWRPAHYHFRIQANGFRPLITELFPAEAEHLDDDVGFGVRESLIVRANSGSQEEALEHGMPFPFSTVNYDFLLASSSEAN